jgi:hypothetical protein
MQRWGIGTSKLHDETLYNTPKSHKTVPLEGHFYEKMCDELNKSVRVWNLYDNPSSFLFCKLLSRAKFFFQNFFLKILCWLIWFSASRWIFIEIILFDIFKLDSVSPCPLLIYQSTVDLRSWHFQSHTGH